MLRAVLPWPNRFKLPLEADFAFDWSTISGCESCSPKEIFSKKHSNKLVTSATLLVTSALLVVTKSYNNMVPTSFNTSSRAASNHLALGFCSVETKHHTLILKKTCAANTLPKSFGKDIA